ncbi:hypothetical protein B296_00029267, partial [Ensete ventricosum]
MPRLPAWERSDASSSRVGTKRRLSSPSEEGSLPVKNRSWATDHTGNRESAVPDGPRIDILSDWYIPPVSGGTDRNGEPCFEHYYGTGHEPCLVDFSSVSNEAESTDIAEVSLMKFLSSTLLNLLLVSLQVIYVGLHIVTPLISLELLKYPKLSCDYFALVSHLLEVYPEKVAQLNMEAFEHIVRTLDFGVRHQHWRKMLKMELAGSAADAILPLVLCEQDLYQ